MNHPPATLLLTSLLTLVATAAAPAGAPGSAPGTDARFTSDGRLKAPEGYREWIFLTSGLDMSYRKDAGMDHSMFDNVFVDPVAYRVFMQTGTWPEGTVLVKEGRVASEKGSINESGKFQSGGTMGVEVHIKDSQRFTGGWAFFFFSSVRGEPAQQIPASASCYSCHQEHGAVDTTFVQFYPTLLDVAIQKHTLSSTYRP